MTFHWRASVAAMIAVMIAGPEVLVGQLTRTMVTLDRAVSSTDRVGAVELLSPALLLAQRNGIVVFDYGDQSLKALQWDGTLRWTQGRKGAGPAEYGHVVDMHEGPMGLIALLDESNGRVAFVDSLGRSVKTVAVPSGARKILSVPAPGDVDLLLLREWQILEVRGGQQRTRPMWTPRPSQELLLSEPVLPTKTPDSLSLVAMRWDRTIMLREGLRIQESLVPGKSQKAKVVVRKVPGMNATVKRVEPGAEEVARSIGANGECVFVLAYAGEDDPRILDVFRRRDGQYRHSLRLPVVAKEIAVLGDRLFILAEDPVPAVIGFLMPTTVCR